MNKLKEYKSLISDLITFLKDSDAKYIDSFSNFLKKEEQKFKKKSLPLKDGYFEKKKYNLGFINQISTEKSIPDKKIKTSQPSTLISEKDSIKNNDIKIDNVPSSTKEIKKIPTEKKQKIFDQKLDEKFQQKELSKDETHSLSEEKRSLEKNKKITIFEKPKIFEDTFQDIKDDVIKTFTNLSFQEPLDDKIARKKAKKYQLKNIAANITILAYKENEKSYKFLEKLSIALGVYFYPAKVVSAYLIEKENNWKDFLSQKDILLIISSDYTIFELPNLKKHYKEKPFLLKKYLNDIELFLLPDISIYFKQPYLKSSLFQALKQKIENITDE